MLIALVVLTLALVAGCNTKSGDEALNKTMTELEATKQILADTQASLDKIEKEYAVVPCWHEFCQYKASEDSDLATTITSQYRYKTERAYVIEMNLNEANILPISRINAILETNQAKEMGVEIMGAKTVYYKTTVKDVDGSVITLKESGTKPSWMN